ncbi:hypothetical protein DC28_01025 [Spirochaeta lutea]|uniref:Uncharacterized protein n=1 Tax=Spirochaeta lutea TaxID=1480694 RepID=A0A098R1L3_9SPIO|nr:hypothetical protein DC28_01025 [Spirochaeta lutea]
MDRKTGPDNQVSPAAYPGSFLRVLCSIWSTIQPCTHLVAYPAPGTKKPKLIPSLGFFFREHPGSI